MFEIKQEKVQVNTLVLTQLVVVLVNVSVTEPGATPVTTPALVTVATAVLLLVQVPPVLGVTLAVEPIKTLVAPPKTGKALTDIVPVAFTPLQPLPVKGIE